VIIATEIDLGITEDQLATIPTAFTVIGHHPEWAQPWNDPGYCAGNRGMDRSRCGGDSRT
jgi:hypothetical protein